MNGFATAMSPADGTGQFDIQAQLIRRRFQAVRLLHRHHGRFNFAQGARQPCGKAIGQQTESTMTFWAIPAWNTYPWRVAPLVGTVAGKRTAPLRMHRTTDQTCIQPGLLGNVFLTGEPRY